MKSLLSTINEKYGLHRVTEEQRKARENSYRRLPRRSAPRNDVISWLSYTKQRYCRINQLLSLRAKRSNLYFSAPRFPNPHSTPVEKIPFFSVVPSLDSDSPVQFSFLSGFPLFLCLLCVPFSHLIFPAIAGRARHGRNDDKGLGRWNCAA